MIILYIVFVILGFSFACQYENNRGIPPYLAGWIIFGIIMWPIVVPILFVLSVMYGIIYAIAQIGIISANLLFPSKKK